MTALFLFSKEADMILEFLASSPSKPNANSTKKYQREIPISDTPHKFSLKCLAKYVIHNTTIDPVVQTTKKHLSFTQDMPRAIYSMPVSPTRTFETFLSMVQVVKENPLTK